MSIRLRLGLILMMIVGTSSGVLALRGQPGLATVAHAVQSVPAAPPQSVIAVTTTDDDFTPDNGTCSLREAVYAAVHDIAVDSCPAGTVADIVALPEGTYGLSLTGTLEDSGFTGDLDITGTLQLTGVTSATTIIDGGRNDRILDIFDGNVAIENLTLRNGLGVWGGGVRLHQGALTVSHSTIRSNLAVTDDSSITYGGGILNQAGTLTVTHSLLANNRATNEYMGAAGYGGGIYSGPTAHTTIMTSTLSNNWPYSVSNRGTLLISNTLFHSNEHGVANSGTAHIERSRFFDHESPTVANAGTLTLSASEIAGTQAARFQFYCTKGGAIAASGGTTTIQDSYVHHNRSHLGAGVYARNAHVNIIGSSIVSNTVQYDWLGREVCLGQGAGVYARDSTVSIVNSTVTANQARYNGAGVYGYQAQIDLVNSTIVGNHNELIVPNGRSNSHVDGAGLLNEGVTGVISLTNTLVAHNTSRATADAADCYGTITSLGYNLIAAPQPGCTITGTLTGVLTNVDPILGTFDYHGGSTLSWSLYPASPAIDAGSPEVCPATDQRGQPRPADGDGVGGPRCDIGSYERQPSDPELPTVTPSIIPTATEVPLPTATATETATVPPTATTGTPGTPTQTPSLTAEQTPGTTATAIETAIPSILPTATVPPTATATATAIPSISPTQSVGPANKIHLPLLLR